MGAFALLPDKRSSGKISIAVTPLLADFVSELQSVISAEILTDPTTRLLYSTDASIYQIEPLGVIFPRTGDDLPAIVEVANRFNIPLLARGSGSSLAGQAIGPAMILDFSRYLNRLIEINPEEQTVLVEPGLILNALNRATAKYGLHFGPDPASAERATLGGCIGNNATGAHSILYGMTADHILDADVVLSDGSLTVFREVTLETAKEIAAGNRDSTGCLPDIYAAALKIRQEYAVEIHDNWPKTWRRVSGYNLNYLIPWSSARPPQWWIQDGTYPNITPGKINLAPLLAGSEGTLAILRRARLRLVPLPRHTILCVLHYSDIGQACDAVPELLEVQPSAIELIPRSLVRLAKSVPAYAHQLSFIRGDPAALLVVELSGDDICLLKERASALSKKQGEWEDLLTAETLDEQKQVWNVRKVGLGILMSRPGEEKPIAFIEDTAVPVEHLGQFVREMERILAEHHVQADYYGHASAGCLHIRPLLNLRTSQGVRDLRSIAKATADLVLKLGGAISAEHGDGLARSEWIESAYGGEIYAAFRLLKNAADPKNLLNPGKIIDPQPMDQNLRYGENYQAKGWQPVMDFSRWGRGDGKTGLARAVEQCNGAGVCRKADGVMCPSFQATQNEMHSTRGRANLLRAMISGRFPAGHLPEKAVREALDLCLACKGCKAECPSAVDMAKLKYEFLHFYYLSGRERRPLRDALFGYIGLLGEVGYRFSAVVNPFRHLLVSSGLGERLFGLSARRQFPAFARQSLHDLVSDLGTDPDPDCLFLSDAFTEYFQPQVGLAALKILRSCGIRSRLLSIIGAGRTLISKGFLDAAKRHGEKLLREIESIDPDRRLPVVGVEPSEIYTLRDEYLDLFPGDERSTSLINRSWMIDEYLIRPDTNSRILLDRLSSKIADQANGPNKVLLHGHCYQRVQPPAEDGYPTGVNATVRFLEKMGFEVSVIADGCCGMAGAFGYEAEHYDVSMKIGELALFPAVRQALAGEWLIAAAGVSCQVQIKDGTSREANHPVELALSRLREK